MELLPNWRSVSPANLMSVDGSIAVAKLELKTAAPLSFD